MLLCLLGVGVVYGPGLRGGFMFDDFPNIVMNEGLRISGFDRNSLVQASLSGISGPFGRPVSMLSFALNAHAAGLDPWAFKLTNLVIHLINGFAIYLLAVLLLRAHRLRSHEALAESRITWIAFAVAASWAVHPINATSVLYVVQRMTSLSSLFMLAGLIVYVWGRIRLQSGKSGMPHVLIAVGPCTVLAVLCKEIGALLPAYLLVVELVLFRFQAPTSRVRISLVAVFALFLALPLLGLLVKLAWQPGALFAGYQWLGFTAAERLMTEFRVLWFYLGLILLPDGAALSMFHDDIAVSHGLLDPPSTLLAAVGLVALLGAGLATFRRAPFVSFGIAFFLAGHSLESSVIALEIAHEHRNYLPSFGVLLAFYYYLLKPFARERYLRLRTLSAVIVIGLSSWVTGERATGWSHPLAWSVYEAQRHPQSARAAYEAGRAFAIVTDPAEPDAVDGIYSRARGFLERAAALNPIGVNAHIGLIILSYRANRTPEEHWLHAVRRRLEAAPISPSTTAAVASLFDCQIDARCHLSDDYLREVIAAAQRHPTFTGRLGALLLATFSHYVADGLGDPAGALDFARRAQRADPNELHHYLHLAEIYHGLGQIELARGELEFAREADDLARIAHEGDRKRLLLMA